MHEAGHLDGSHRRHAGQKKRRGEPEVLRTDFAGNNLVQLALQIILRHKGFAGLPSPFIPSGFRQAFAVYFAVVVTGYRLYLHDQLGHHVGRLQSRHMTLDSIGIELAFAGDVGHNIGAVERVVGRLDGGFLHTRTRKHGSLHLTQLNAETANLDQAVATSGKQEIAIGVTTHEVARAECALIALLVLVVERIAHEDVGCQLRMVQITPAELRAADPKFARLAVGRQFAVFPDNIQTVSAGALADGDIVLAALDSVTGNHAASLRRTVDVDEIQARCRCDRIQLFTADGKEAQRRTTVHRDELTSGHGAHDDMGDGVVVNELRQTHEVETHVLGNDIQGAARRKRAEDVVHGRDEREAGIRSHPAAGIERQRVFGLVGQEADVALLDHAALGLTRGAAGVDEQSQSIAADVFLEREALQRRLLLQIFRKEHGDFSGFCQDASVLKFQSAVREHCPVGDQQLGAAVAQHEVMTLGGISRIHGHIGTSGSQHANGSNGHPLAARNQDTHNVLFPQTLLENLLRHDSGPCQKFAVSEARSAAGQSNVVRRPGSLLQDYINNRCCIHGVFL